MKNKEKIIKSIDIFIGYFWGLILTLLTILGVYVQTSKGLEQHQEEETQIHTEEGNDQIASIEAKNDLARQQALIAQYEHEQEIIKEKLSEAMLASLVVWTNPNTEDLIYASKCRNSVFGCEDTIGTYSGFFVDIANEYGLDPFLLASIAKHESNFNAFAEGKRGERGVMQILPYSPIANNVSFVLREPYRRRCKATEGHCQEEVIQAASRALVASLRACNDNLEQALTRYNTGRCSVDGNRYSSNVLEVYETMTSQL